jgi:hypothetical protein
MVHKNSGLDGCLIAVWLAVIVLNIAFLGVVIWAIIALVTYFTGG